MPSDEAADVGVSTPNNVAASKAAKHSPGSEKTAPLPPARRSRKSALIDPKTGARTSPAASGINIHVRDLIGLLQDRIKAFGASRHKELLAILHDAYEIYQEAYATGEGEAELLSAYEAHKPKKIKIIKSTPNLFVPLLKFFIGPDIDKTNLGRYAAALNHALKERVETDGLLRFIEDQGGLTALADAAAAARPPERQSATDHQTPKRPTKKQAEALAALRKTALIIEPPSGLQLPKGQFRSILIEACPNGEFTIIGARAETPSTLKRYQPLSGGREEVESD